jgi:5-methylcytosine-specific restriction endonuclease McrA
MSRISRGLRDTVRRRARGLCEYCRSCEEYTGHEFTMDHVLPESRGGSTRLGNLCWCCFWCNNYKQARTEWTNPRSRQAIRLFNPRTDSWQEHFRWSRDFSRIIGRTPTGRATIQLLRLNRRPLVLARRIWARHGLHPVEP